MAVASISFIQVKLLPIGKFELILSDGLFLLILLIFLFKGKIVLRKNEKLLLACTVFFICMVILSASNAVNFVKFSLGLLPLIYALIIVIASSATINLINNDHFYKTLFYIISFSIILSFIPTYFSLFGLTSKWLSLYSAGGWRYQYLTQNPNQYSVYLVTSIFTVTLISIKKYPHLLKYVILINFFGMIPALESGSRTGLFALFISLFFLLGYQFVNLNVQRKLIIGTLATLFILFVVIPLTTNFLLEYGGQFNRALSVFERISSGDAYNPSEMGATGESIKKGIQYFLVYPLTGVGLGNFSEYNRHEIHNTPVSILAETGMLGFLAFLIVFASFFYAIWTSRSSFSFKMINILFIALFIVMNYPHYLFRQRWVWFFFTILMLINSNHRQTPYYVRDSRIN